MTFTPAAADTIYNFLKERNYRPDDLDVILTGDLGSIGSQLLNDILYEEYRVNIRGVQKDCGNMIFDPKKQDVHAGGSGCGCSAVVFCSDILNRLRTGELKRILFVGTGALLSPIITLQGKSIPSIAHGIELTHNKIKGKENE